jgi:hypothetical protein
MIKSYGYAVIKLEDAGGRERCVVIGSHPDSSNLEKTIEEGKKTADYYLNECKYNVRIEITENCHTCNGDSRGIFHPQKRNKFLGTWKKCPNCKGKLEYSIIKEYIIIKN